MVDIKTKTVLYLNLEKRTAEVKVYANLSEWVGGLGVALKLLSQNPEKNPLVLANGPFTLSFPLASKTCAVFRSPFDKKIREAYVGGRFGAVLLLSGFSALVILGKARRPLFVAIENDRVSFRKAPAGCPLWEKEGLAGLRSTLTVGEKEILVDGRFRFGGAEIGEVLKGKNLAALVVSGTQSYKIADRKGYEILYGEILGKVGSLAVTAANYSSCFGCPLGCREAAAGEGKKEECLSSVLVGCRFADAIYDDVAKVFSCLGVLGLTYHHEDLETLPEKIGHLRTALS